MGKGLLECSGKNKDEWKKQSGKNAAKEHKVLQSGGQTIKPRTLKALNLTKKQGRDAIHELKEHLGLPNNFHGKIMSNGDYLHPSTREWLGNLLNYTD
jgi:hypothetical protein